MRTLWLRVSQITSTAPGAMAMPSGAENWADVPHPFWEPPVSEPAIVVTNPEGEMARTRERSFA